jgi:hypothetical protein
MQRGHHEGCTYQRERDGKWARASASVTRLARMAKPKQQRETLCRAGGGS